MKYTSSLKELSHEDSGTAGGKGASLGELMQVGLSVPDGYVVLANAFDHFLSETDLTLKIEIILSNVKKNKMRSIDTASSKIQSLILNETIPEDISDEILSRYIMLGSEYVAVRSSATAEDGADYAWAGLLSTYLNSNRSSLLKHVQSCWASLFTSRAIHYRLANKLKDTHISVAVVIQQMIHSKKSGVAFSVHPVTQNSNQMIIEAGLGLGEAIVSGSVTPDSYIISKNPRNIIEIEINTQSKAIDLSNTSEGSEINTILGLDSDTGGMKTLDDSQIFELANLVINIEEHYQYPCDIEWAYTNGSFYIVQARPITTLKNFDHEAEKYPEYIKIWSREYGVQFFYAALFGLTSDILPEKIQNALTISENGMQSLYIEKVEIEKLNKAIKKLYVDDIENLETHLDNFVSDGQALVNKTLETRKKDFSAFTDRELIALLEEFINQLSHFGGYMWTTFLINEQFSAYVSMIIDGLKIDEKSKTQLKKFAFTPQEHAGILSLSHQAKNKSITKLITEFDWLTVIDVHNEPATVEQLADLVIDLKRESSPLASLSTLSGHEMDRIKLCRRVTFVKDARDDYRRRAMRNMLTLYDELANRSNTERQSLSFLTIEEIRLLLLEQPQKLLAESKNRREKGFAVTIKNDELIQTSQKKWEKILGSNIDKGGLSTIKGTIAETGKATGKVVIVRNTADLRKVKKGMIMCAVTTNPNYTLAMKKSVAFITDEGGITCHAAIIARELSKPCLVGTKNATQLLKDGDEVEVDAFNGTIKIISTQNSA